ncbi:MAG: EAL domain-containing protein [Gammaproteobacteria bacterium]
MYRKNSYKVLVIDDDPTLRMLAESRLTKSGYQVLTAATGADGISVAIENAPDILLLDYELPDMTGVNVCRVLRNNDVKFIKPILFIAGKDDLQSIENAFQVGATDFSRKPLNWTILIYRIKYLLHAHDIYLSLLSSEERLTNAQQLTKIANWEYSPVDKNFQWSESIFDILEINSEGSLNLCFQDFLDRIPEKELSLVKDTVENCFNNYLSFQIEHTLITVKGSKKIIHHLGDVIKNANNEIISCIGTIQDITERRDTENQIRRLAYYDSLTGLMNRESFLLALDSILSSKKITNELSALLFIDLDNFKRVNDTLGHDYGDSLLRDVAGRLKQCVRTAELENEAVNKDKREIFCEISDQVFRNRSIDINRYDLGRLGGDEFTVFLADILNHDTAVSVARRLLKTLEKPFSLAGTDVYITFSIGIAIAPKDGCSIQTLLKNADTAMYNAKRKGKNNYQMYVPEMDEQALYRLTLETDLRNALELNEMYLVYQPQICLHSGALVGSEVLMRWKHSNRGEISPVEFIPLAEETGQIIVLGDWLLECCSKDLQKWKVQGVIPEEFKLVLNVSSLQFGQSNMIDKVKRFFPDLELNKHVEFELTESIMMENTGGNKDELEELAACNITLSIDNFGTGFSSLSYLHRFPVHTVKIDRSFISNMQKEGQENIVKAIIAMAHGLGLKVIAAGVENQWQHDFLKAEGCDIGQGYFYDKPMHKDQFEVVLQK